MSTYYHYLQEDGESKILKEATAYSLLIELGSLQVKLPALDINITPNEIYSSHYWTKETTHQPNWHKE